MIRKTDKLVLQSFFGLFFLTFSVVLFILLMVFMSRYFDDMIGKDLGFTVLARLFFYFSLTLIPQALPLSILLSSLMAFGNLGEHNELTALKSLGIPLTRLLIPIGIFACVISVAAFFFNNYAIPEINLKAYSLLYDVKRKKPALDFVEGAFYNGLQGWSIRIDKKTGKDGRQLHGVMIYDHRQNRGNTDLVVAETGYMETIHNDTYLRLDLRNGMRFSEQRNYNDRTRSTKEGYIREQFDSAQMLFSLDEFGFNETPEESFRYHRAMMNVSSLAQMSDSLYRDVDTIRMDTERSARQYYIHAFTLKRDSLATATRAGLLESFSASLPRTLPQGADWSVSERDVLYTKAINRARNIRSLLEGSVERQYNFTKEARRAYFSLHEKFTLSVACFVMFVIGAPLGAIIKKGGLGLPVLVSVFFYILQYVLGITGKKWARESVVSVEFGSWYGIGLLLAIGLFFFWQARKDSRVFEADVYLVVWDRLTKPLVERWRLLKRR
ncbi:MAG: LptF/LptG family permease [Bernardetiaceae bacterium]